MDSMIVQYVLFILVALLIIAGVVALNRWLYRQSKPRAGGPATWVKLDTRRPEVREEALASAVLADDDDEDEDEADLRVRARQNGHHANGSRPQM